MTAAVGILELTGHARRACADLAGSSRSLRYADALAAQASALRTAALDLEAEAQAIRDALGARDKVDTAALDETILSFSKTRRAIAAKKNAPLATPYYLKKELDDE